MKREFDWQDLKLFLAVARNEGLSGASRETGTSPATLGRRMAMLEEALGMRLFHRGARGYALTEEAGDLLVAAQEMESSASAIDAWMADGQTQRRIRISAGYWTIRLLADNLTAFWKPEDDWVPEFLSDLQKRDIARRQIDIGVRNAPPEEPWLAGQKVGTVRFCAYCSTDLQEPSDKWIGFVEGGANSPTGRWLYRNVAEKIGVTVNDASHALSVARTGQGNVVLPTFVGDTMKDLKRVRDELSELETERWLVMHHEDRHRSQTRQAINALRSFLKTDPMITN